MKTLDKKEKLIENIATVMIIAVLIALFVKVVLI